MLETAALLALCVQVADLSSLYLSFEPTGANLEQVFNEAEIRWSDQLRVQVGDDTAFIVAMHDGFRAAMEMDGERLWLQWVDCQGQLDGATPDPAGKG